MKRLELIMLTTLGLVLLAGCGKVDKTIEQSESMVQSSDYAGAMQSIESLDEEELSEEQLARIESMYITIAEATTEYQDRLDVLEAGLKIVTESDKIKSMYISNIEEKVSFYEEGEDYVEALTAITRAKEALPEDESVNSIYEEVKSLSEERQPYVDTLVHAKELIDSADWKGLADYSVSDEGYSLSSFVGDEGSFTYVAGGGTTGDAIAFYSSKGCDCAQWYIGPVTDGIMDGNGGWYWARSDVDGIYYEYYTGKFVDGKPNGEGTNIAYKYDRAYEVTGVFVDGLENGNFDMIYTDPEGTSYYGQYNATMGIVEDTSEKYSIPIDSGGYYTYCFLRTEDGSSAHVEKSPQGEIHGVAHFR